MLPNKPRDVLLADELSFPKNLCRKKTGGFEHLLEERSDASGHRFKVRTDELENISKDLSLPVLAFATGLGIARRFRPRSATTAKDNHSSVRCERARLLRRSSPWQKSHLPRRANHFH
jgi:hypothetical protein